MHITPVFLYSGRLGLFALFAERPEWGGEQYCVTTPKVHWENWFQHLFRVNPPSPLHPRHFFTSVYLAHSTPASPTRYHDVFSASISYTSSTLPPFFRLPLPLSLPHPILAHPRSSLLSVYHPLPPRSPQFSVPMCFLLLPPPPPVNTPPPFARPRST